MKNLFWKILAIHVSLLMGSSVLADALEPPKLRVVDRNSVNVAAGKLNISQTDLTIGSKERPLTHTISSYGNEFLGYTENHRGRIYLAQRRVFATNTYINMMRVVTGEQTIDFDIVNGAYVGLRNQRSTLVRSGNTYLFTAEDGTEMKFICESAEANAKAVMVEKKFPNGYTITIHLQSNVSFSPFLSVTTNTGLQFKYRYVDVNDGNPNSLSWSREYPRSIIAVNNAVEYCSPGADDCRLANTWPTVTYDWPAGMPKSMRTSYQFGEKVFKVTDAMGAVTEYYQKGFDLYEGLGSDSPGSSFIPSVTKIKNNQGIIEYDYKNYVTGGHLKPFEMKQAVVLYKAVRNEVTWDYSLLNEPTDIGKILVTHVGRGYDSVSANTDLVYGALVSARTSDQTFEYERSFSNPLERVTYKEGNITIFGYDGRGHINKTSDYPRPGSSMAPLVREAGYDATCTNPKTCNQPNWVSDAMGQRTDYTYHPQSGQVATITKPAPTVGGVRPQTRYTYTQKYAWYKNSSGNYVQASSAIWLLATEAFCRTTASTGSGCSVANDEVVTTYDYGPNQGSNNLFLRGVAVTADGETRRTCYAYDNFGNRIGETLPKANLTSCP